MIRTSALFAAALAFSLAACKTAPEAAPQAAAGAKDAAGLSPADFYPLALGNSWTYELVGQKHEETIQIVGRDGPWFLDDHKGRLRADSEGVRDKDRYLLHAPLKAGAKWSAVESLVVQRFEVTAMDASAVTRAGTFLHCVTVRNEQPLDKGQGRFVTEWTYAPQVGLVQLKQQTIALSGKAVLQTSLELVAYDAKH